MATQWPHTGHTVATQLPLVKHIQNGPPSLQGYMCVISLKEALVARSFRSCFTSGHCVATVWPLCGHCVATVWPLSGHYVVLQKMFRLAVACLFRANSFQNGRSLTTRSRKLSRLAQHISDTQATAEQQYFLVSFGGHCVMSIGAQVRGELWSQHP